MRVPFTEMSDYKRLASLTTRVMGNVKIMIATETMPGECASFELVATRLHDKAQRAGTSKRMYEIANRAEYLYQQSSILVIIAQIMSLIGSEKIPPEERKRISNKVSLDWYNIMTYFEPRRDLSSLPWDTYMEKVRNSHATLRGIMDELWAAASEEEKRRMAELLLPVDKKAKLSVQNHDTFLIKLKRHDFFYSYSDDIVVWRGGQAQRAEIMTITKLHPHYLKMWEVYAAAQGFDKPNPEPLYEQLRMECSFP